MTTKTGLCIGGPLAGQTLSYEKDHYKVVLHSGEHTDYLHQSVYGFWVWAPSNWVTSMIIAELLGRYSMNAKIGETTDAE